MAKRQKQRLTDAAIRKAADGTHGDGNGLSLRVGKGGTQKSWIVRCMVDGNAVVRGLGSYPDVSLATARKNAAAMRSELKDGVQPTPTRRPTRPRLAPIADAMTFQQAAERVIELRRPTWSSARHAKQWTESLTNHTYPAIGHLPIADVTARDCLELLTPIWNELPETSARVKQRMGVVFDWAVAAGLRPDNPAAAVGKALPRRPRLKEHHPAMPYENVGCFLETLRQSGADRATKLALEFVILTAGRAGEIRGATWEEIDIENRVWTVPAERMKMRRPHRVPLSERACHILLEAGVFLHGKSIGYPSSGLLFPNQRTGKPLSNMAFTELLRRLELPYTTHGFRSTFRDWSIDVAGVDWAIGEAALAHRLGDTMESAYARTDLFDRRRELMQQWNDYLNGGTTNDVK